MSEDIAHRVADYAHKLLAVHVKQEYENQIGKWEKHINLLIAHAKTAFKSHEDTLNKIKAQQMAEQQARAELFMLAFSLLAGPSISWVAGSIEHKLVPRYFGKRKETLYVLGGGDAVRPKPKLPPPFGPRKRETIKFEQYVWMIDPHHHNQTTAKVFGDFGGSLVSALLVNPAIKAVSPSRKEFDLQLAMLGDSFSIELFEANIKNLLQTGKQMGSTAIVNYAGTILDDALYGERWIKKLRSEQPRLKGLALEEEIRLRIREIVDLQRQEWAKNKDWLYFGNDPKPQSQIISINNFEAEIWALWIIMEEYRIYFPRVADTLFSEAHSVKLEGKSGIELDRVLNRLVELGVILGRTDKEKNRQRQPVAQALQTIPVRKPTPANLLGAIDRATEKAGLLPIEVSGIKGRVDTREELALIQDWASKRKYQSKLKDPLAAIPRPLKPINIVDVQ